MQALLHLCFAFGLLWTNTFLHDGIELALGDTHHHYESLREHSDFHHHDHHADDNIATVKGLRTENHFHVPLAISHFSDLELHDADEKNTVVHSGFVIWNLASQPLNEQAWQRPPPEFSNKYGLPIYLLHRRLLI